MDFKCNCGKNLVEHNGLSDDNTDRDSVNCHFICEDENCQKLYDIEFTNISGTTCGDCGGELGNEEQDGGVTDITEISAFFTCEDCGEDTEVNFHPIDSRLVENPTPEDIR